MGLERRWLQAVTIVFLIYLSKYEMQRFKVNIFYVTVFTFTFTRIVDGWMRFLDGWMDVVS